MESTRNIGNPKYGGLLLRRTMPMIRGKEGLLDKTRWLYNPLRATLREQTAEWRFPSGAQVKLDSIQYEKDLDNFQGTEYDYVGFDELTQFTETMFWYLWSRCRSTNGIKPYMRATCNPDAESWVRELITWWIGEDGYAIAERDGVLRYFIRLGGAMIWGNSKQEVYEQAKNHPDFIKQVELQAEVGNHWSSLITSMTYIHGSVYNNKTLMKENPSYIANLMGLPEAEKRRFLDGNWLSHEDGMNLVEYNAARDIFSNYKTQSSFRCITCDAARFGRDLMVIMVWEGWEILQLRIRKISDAQDIVGDIEADRMKFGIMKSNVLVDNDGVGGDTVKLGQYIPFSNAAPPFISRDVKKKENYKYLKDQCAYHAAEQINLGLMRFIVTDSNVLIFEGSRFLHTRKIKIGSKVWDVSDLLKAQVRTWKRVERKDTTEPMRLNSKDEQKIMLGGMSPDLGDATLMRSFFDLRPKAGSVTYRK